MSPGEAKLRTVENHGSILIPHSLNPDVKQVFNPNVWPCRGMWTRGTHTITKHQAFEIHCWLSPTLALLSSVDIQIAMLSLDSAKGSYGIWSEEGLWNHYLTEKWLSIMFVSMIEEILALTCSWLPCNILWNVFKFIEKWRLSCFLFLVLLLFFWLGLLIQLTSNNR